MARRSKSEYLNFIDNELRVLICITVYGPLSRADLSTKTGIKKGNLTPIVDGLLSRCHLKEQNPPQTIDKAAGRPTEDWLVLAYPQKIYDIIIELEYRKEYYTGEIKLRQRELHAMAFREPEENERERLRKIVLKRLALGSGRENLDCTTYRSIRYCLKMLREKAKEEKIPLLPSQDCEWLNAPI